MEWGRGRGGEGGWGHGGVAHAVEDFLIDGADGSEDAAELSLEVIALAGDEVIGAEAGATFLVMDGLGFEVDPIEGDAVWFMVALEDVG